MLFYFLGLIVVISSVFFFFRDSENLFEITDELSHIQLKILKDEKFFIAEQRANQSRALHGEYISPTIAYRINGDRND